MDDPKDYSDQVKALKNRIAVAKMMEKSMKNDEQRQTRAGAPSLQETDKKSAEYAPQIEEMLRQLAILEDKRDNEIRNMTICRSRSRSTSVRAPTAEDASRFMCLPERITARAPLRRTKSMPNPIHRRKSNTISPAKQHPAARTPSRSSSVVSQATTTSSLASRVTKKSIKDREKRIKAMTGGLKTRKTKIGLQITDTKWV